MNAAFQTPNLAQASEGSKALAYALNLSAVAILDVDLSQERMLGKIDFIQSVYIDNADNAVALDLTFFGAPIPQRVRCPANAQGWFPVSWPVEASRFRAASNAGGTINVILANFAMPYLVWGPPSGIIVVPPLINPALNALNFPGAGNQQLVAGVAAQTVKLFRGIFSVDSPAILTFTDGPGGTVLFAASLTAGGSLTFEVSGVPWFNGTAGKDLTLNSSAACNVYGGFGYVQS